MTIYEPKNYSDEGLAEHGERIAGRAALTLEQARHLVAEIRNAITPARERVQGVAPSHVRVRSPHRGLGFAGCRTRIRASHAYS